ncbi:MAG TPA: hypothetical protein VEZ17_10840, partial [Chitinophagaceae bacterium]|nr:hypothetical protein [Chitinophagaceae bacterium]
MIELRTRWMVKDGTYNKLRGASKKIFEVNILGWGNSKFVRQLKKAGGLSDFFAQLLQVHNQGRKDTQIRQNTLSIYTVRSINSVII